MKKILTSLLTVAVLSLPSMASAVTYDLVPVEELNARAEVLGIQSFEEWSPANSFWAGYEGFVDMCENYLTEESLEAVKASNAGSAGSIQTAITDHGQSVDEWRDTNPWE